MDHKSVWLTLEKFIRSHQKLSQQYGVYLQKNKDFNGENFCEVLLLFDLFLESLNKKQKQIKTTSPLLKKQAYRISLIYNRVKHGRKRSRIPWWNEIIEGIFLGALPLRRHPKRMKEVGVQRVLSMVEPFEHKKSYAGTPVTHERWQEEGVLFENFPSPDFKPISLKTLFEAACFVNESKEKKESVYIHCKAGRGRSAAVVMAYLILFENYSYEKAEEIIRSKRPHIDLENKRNNIQILHHLYLLYFQGLEDLSFLEEILI